MKKPHSLSLDEKVTKETKEKISSFGGTLSGFVEKLLIKFNKGEIKI